MAKKRLSLQDVDHMKAMVLKGVAPEDIGKHFSIAVSSVHNYKNRFKQEGLSFPDVRGKRPTGSVNLPNNSEVKNSSSVKNTHGTREETASAGKSSMNFVVNGVAVHVSSEAKNVNISKNSIEVNF